LNANGIAGNAALTVFGSNVGIGTTSPLYLMDAFNSNQLSTIINSRSDIGRFGVNANGNSSSLQVYAIRDISNTPGWASASLYIQQLVDATAMGYLRFGGFANQQGISLGTAGSDRITVLSGGSVGVNCNAPAYQLDVNGLTRTRGLITADNGSSGTFINNGTTTTIFSIMPGGCLLSINVEGTNSNWAATITKILYNKASGLYYGSSALASQGTNPAIVVTASGSTVQIALNNNTGTNQTFYASLAVMATTP
jgi:hypothetical protein